MNKASYLLDYVSKSMPLSLRKVTVPLCLPLVRPPPVCCVQFKAPQYKRDTDIVEQVRQGHQDSQMLEHRTHARRRGRSWDCSIWRRVSARESYHCLNVPVGDHKKMEAGTSQKGRVIG